MLFLKCEQKAEEEVFFRSLILMLFEAQSETEINWHEIETKSVVDFKALA